ncbi:ADAMTS 2 [Labeo rohita]|uniref:ADAMTS 2 n=1 Tax=Labeo rohita TaxID=84645 RepID=A0A498MML2_LABRO|nr:ADAMTS 2 [Labeo rohita]
MCLLSFVAWEAQKRKVCLGPLQPRCVVCGRRVFGELAVLQLCLGWIMNSRMRIWSRAQYVESSLVLLGLVTLALSLGNLSSRGQEEGVASNSLEDGLEVITYWWGEWTKWTACTRTCGGGVMSQERHCLKQRKKTMTGKDNMTCTGNAKKYHLCNAKPIGCDGVLFSPNTLDKCGVCQGDGSSCSRITGSFRRGASSLGYSFITQIPEGSWDIQIIERKKSADILAVTDQAGNFFFNGAYKVDTPQNFHAAGTIFKYRRPTDVYETGIEYIVAKGPIDQPINVLVWNQNGQNPYITYEYTVMRDSMASVSQPPIYTGPQGGSSLVSVEVGSVLHHNESVFDKTVPEMEGNQVQSTGPRAVEGQKPGKETNEVYETANIDCEQDANTQVQYTEGNCSWPSGVGAPGVVPVNRPAEDMVNSENLIWRVLLGERIGSDGVLANISTNQLLTRRDGLSSESPLELDYSSLEQAGLNGSLLEFTLGHRRNDTGDFLLLNRTVTSILRNRGNRTRNNQRLLQKNKLSAADMYRWKLSSQEPCSMTCSIGVSKSLAMCVRYDGIEVDDVYCDALTRPEPVHDFCIGRECQPRWEASSWSECSRTCGEGFQFRLVRCWKMLAPGLDSSVYSDLCIEAQLERPPERRSCKSPTCGPQWEVAEWSECPAKCGRRGLVTREVRCSEETHACDEATQPASTKNCTGPPCVCGQGKTVRHVYCKTPEGRVVPESQCSPENKPLAIHPCGDNECPPHWLAQDWERCNTTCGRGVKRRTVLCVGITGGKVQIQEDEECDDSKRPVDEDTCFERPCFKWYTTPWSECTKTCGVGVRMRDVKCYQGREPVRGCDPLTKPVNKQTCALQPCPTEPPDENCQDRPTTNCSLALKVNLCSHWYYSKACCHSCRNLRAS